MSTLFGCAVVLLVVALGCWWLEVERRERAERSLRESNASWEKLQDRMIARADALQARAHEAERARDTLLHEITGEMAHRVAAEKQIARMTKRPRGPGGRFQGARQPPAA